MLNKLITALHSLDLDPTAEELAEVLWRAFQIRRPRSTRPQIAPVEEDGMEILPKEKQLVQLPPIFPREEVTPEEVRAETDRFPLYPRSPGEKTRSGLPFRTPAARLLPHALKLARALRPLKQWVASRTIYQINEAATIEQIAETQIWLPVLQGIPERRFDIELVVENSGSMEIWPPVIAEFQKLLESLGAFRKVQTWELRMEEGKVHLYTQTHSTTRSRHGKELLDTTQRRLILVISDAVSAAWYNGQITELLEYWGHHHPVAILQMLPQRLWRGTGLGEGLRVNVRAPVANVANRQLSDDSADAWLTDDIPKGIKVPIVTLEADSLNDWAKLVMGKGDNWVQGVIFEFSRVSSKQEVTPSPVASVAGEVTAAQRVQRFTALASPLAQQLAGYLAAVPLTLDVMRLVQEKMLPESGQIHLAEVFLGGLLKREKVSWVKYDFHDGVREILLDSRLVPEGIEVLKVVSKFIEQRLGCALDFKAWLENPAGVKERLDEESRPFAKVAGKVLRRLGGEYAELALRVEESVAMNTNFTGVEPSVNQIPNWLINSWEGHWVWNGSPRDVTLVIDASNPRVATMVIRFKRLGAETIVEQSLRVELIGSEVHLVGTDYKFIELGNAINGWRLDTFVLKITQDRNRLEGILFDNRQREVRVYFVRQPSYERLVIKQEMRTQSLENKQERKRWWKKIKSLFPRGD